MKYFLNIYKPKGITSFDVIALLRKKLKIKQIGHSGTLDPMAEGVLPIAIGKATRLLEYLTNDKEYVCECDLGKVSNTYDLEGKIEYFSDKKVSHSEITKKLESFCGEIEQTPPAFSAIHYNGKRLYELARNGNVPDDIPKRKVFIKSIELLDFIIKENKVVFRVACSKGTYIRSIVHDLGQMLGTGAVMTNLIRTQSSNFNIDSSVKLNKFLETEQYETYFIRPETVLNLPNLELSKDFFFKIKNGQVTSIDLPYRDGTLLALSHENIFFAIGEYSSFQLKAKKVFT